MNKPKLKCLIALLCTLQGMVFLLLALFISTFSSTTFTLLLAFGSISVTLGGIAYYICYQGVKLILKLKNKQLPILAHWTYFPLQVNIIQTALIEEKHSTLSLIILSTLLLILIDIGFILSNTSTYLTFFIITGILIIIGCAIACLLIQLYYNHKSTHPVEAIISNEYIYFCGELYGLNRSLYILEEIQVLDGPQIYLQLIYGSPGTPYDPIYILTLPVPTEDLETALKVKEHFSKLIH